jgi:hypothetical protein
MNGLAGRLGILTLCVFFSGPAQQPGETAPASSGTAEQFPPKVDCETAVSSPARCHWIEIVKYDPAARNDLLPSVRTAPEARAYLGLGGFGFKADAPGPGVLVEWLPEGYKGPLKLQDRILTVAGISVNDARGYTSMMEQFKEEKPTAVVIQRGSQRLRIETRILIPKREAELTGRVQAEYDSDTREVLIATSRVAELRLQLPSYWVPVDINWNGADMGAADKPGCWALVAGAKAEPCGK